MTQEIKDIGTQAEIVDGDIGTPHTEENIVRSAIDIYGRIDVLVSNAASHSFLSMPHEL